MAHETYAALHLSPVIKTLPGEWKLQGCHCHLGKVCAVVVNDFVP